MATITNIGILAHVDAGKTSLTERILFHAGVIPAIGAVDSGTAHTDTLDLERQRGISIQSAVTSFTVDDRIYNLIDTPGHPDFIAEVERVIGVLDAVILVVSAVEGVQPQTRRLSRAIANLGLPCVIFANKIDRLGARTASLIDEIGRELQRDVVVLSDVTGLGTRDAASSPRDLADADAIDELVDVLARRDEVLLDRYVEANGVLDEGDVREALWRQVTDGSVTPVLFGSAMTGAGIEGLVGALGRIGGDGDGAMTGIAHTRDVPGSGIAAEVFKVQRLPKGERVLLCRVWRGVLENRASVPVHQPHAPTGEEHAPAKVTGIEVFRDGESIQTQSACAGDIVRVHGLEDARIGDWLGEVIRDRVPAFEPPVFEARIEAVDPAQHMALNVAIADLADQDPLIGLRRDPVSGEMFVRLYGEVQQEVIAATLADAYGIAVTFDEPSVVYVERLIGEGHAAEIFPDTKPPFYATVGFRIRPKQGRQSTWRFTPGKAKQGFFDAAEAGGRAVLEQGLYGWPVIDWDVEVTDLIYLVTSVPVSYRNLAMLVMAEAIRQAGTMVCEPVHEATVRVPPESMGAVIHAVAVHRGVVETTSIDGDLAVVTGMVPAAEIDALTRELPGLTNGWA
ncbi:MAG TPA: translation factor GTPase family protein, partial [Thermomicrobiales bacterium]|nr:translation factor GTPase family protein [Thermomicrobiales bacterium]